MPDETADSVAAAKAALRAVAVAGRADMHPEVRDRERRDICRAVLGWCRTELAHAAVVACYEPLRSEPGSVALLASLAHRGLQVLVPITYPDNDLGWRFWRLPPGPEAEASPEAGPGPEAGLAVDLGPDAISTAALILVPAFTVDPNGHRLGRGGGSYDRALRRARPDATIAALLFEHEFRDVVPAQPWDRPVTAVVTAAGFRPLPPPSAQ